MTLVDLNLILYATDAGSVHHARARAWWDGMLSGNEPVGVCWLVLNGFIRLTTHPRILPRPLAVPDAVARVDAILARPSVRILEPTPEHWSIYRRYLAQSIHGGNLANDAYLAALAYTHGAVIASADADFARFKEVVWVNPVAA
jgi:uncharacterized protein